MFASFGEIESAVVRKEEDGKLCDTGYVCYKNSDDAEKALEGMNKKVFADGQFLIVNRHISKRDNEGQSDSKIRPISQNLTQTFNSNIFVKFIPNDVSEDDIKKTFSEVGKIISIKIKESKRTVDNEEFCQYKYGYILYDKVEEAQFAIKKFDAQSVFGARPLKVELWVSKDEMEQEKKQRESREVNTVLKKLFE